MKGILFKPDMIQATIEGKKTQTRRVIKHPAVPNTDIIGFQEFRDIPPHKDKWQPKSGYYALLRCNASQDFQTIYFRCSYCIGETVYIKEAWAVDRQLDGYCPSGQYNTPVYYHGELDMAFRGRWRSPLFMPEWAARYFVLIEDVRAERLQEITEEDAIAEGMRRQELPYDIAPVWQYQELWDSINKDYPWESNPWVFRYEFEYQTKEKV